MHFFTKYSISKTEYFLLVSYGFDFDYSQFCVVPKKKNDSIIVLFVFKYLELYFSYFTMII